jgi:hypothetical protein
LSGGLGWITLAKTLIDLLNDEMDDFIQDCFDHQRKQELIIDDEDTTMAELTAMETAIKAGDYDGWPTERTQSV